MNLPHLPYESNKNRNIILVSIDLLQYEVLFQKSQRKLKL